MAKAGDIITLIHFNDAYNIEQQREKEPVGGAARFYTAVKSFSHLNPIVLFSGDVFGPSVMSIFTKGEQMIPVLNTLKVQAACYGNHDFDYGLPVLLKNVKGTNFPWLMSNVINTESGRPLAEGKVTHVIEWCGRKIGLFGLVEKEWLDTLGYVNQSDLTYTDFITAGARLARQLKEIHGCKYVIALTHMRTPNDVRLAENVQEIDLILGGHDHVYEKTMINGKYILKSGTDFQQFSVVSIDFTASEEKPRVEIQAIDVTSVYEPDPELSALLEKYTERMGDEMCKELGTLDCELDGRFSSIRKGETELGNLICDIILETTKADVALLNAGTFRSDMIHLPGPFLIKDLLAILPIIDTMVLLEVSGETILKCLENGVSQYPKLEGRFPQISGISFTFDPKRPPGQRVGPQLVLINGEKLRLDGSYKMATKAFLAEGKDGYDCLKDAKRLIDEENGPALSYAVQSHFEAIRDSRERTSIESRLRENGNQQICSNTEARLDSVGSLGKPERIHIVTM